MARLQTVPLFSGFSVVRNQTLRPPSWPMLPKSLRELNAKFGLFMPESFDHVTHTHEFLKRNTYCRLMNTFCTHIHGENVTPSMQSLEFVLMIKNSQFCRDWNVDESCHFWIWERVSRSKDNKAWKNLMVVCPLHCDELAMRKGDEGAHPIIMGEPFCTVCPCGCFLLNV